MIALLSLCIVSNGETSVPAFPDSISINGVEYQFNQAFLEESLARNLDLLRAELKLETSDQNAHAVNVHKTNLAYGLAAAAQFSGMTPKVKAILEEIVHDFGITNESIPAGFTLPQSFQMGMAYQGFVDAHGQPPEGMLDRLSAANFGELASRVYRAIEARDEDSGSKVRK